MEFKTGQILNFKYYEDFFGKTIRWYNMKVYGIDGFTHTAIITNVKPLRMAQAMSKGFEIVDVYEPWLTNCINCGQVVIGESKIPLKNVEETAKKYEGRPYGFLDLINIGLILIFRNKSIGFTGSRALICSEAVCRLLYDCSDKKIMLGFNKKKDKELSEFKKSFDLITPTDISKSKYIKW